jgi:hypothetical protein
LSINSIAFYFQLSQIENGAKEAQRRV